MTKNKLIAFTIIFVVFGGLFATKFWQIDQAMSSRKPPPPPTVSLVEAQMEQWTTRYVATGSVTAAQRVTISNELAGKVERIHFDSGQTVKKGQRLLSQDTTVDVAELNALIADKQLGEVQLKRQRLLLERKATAQSAYDEAKARLGVLKAQVAAKQSLIKKKRIDAPFDGTVGIKNVHLGQFLDKGETITQLVATDKMHADFQLSERYLSQLKLHQSLEVRVQSYPDTIFTASIIAIEPNISEQTRTVAIRALIDNKEQKLRDGMFADIRLISTTKRDVLSLPSTAITFNTYGKNVYVVNKDSQPLSVALRSIQTGQQQNGKTEVLSGLSAGEQVVNLGHQKLRDGGLIQVAQ